MGLEQVYRCDSCRALIDNVKLRGYVVRGNIYAADNPVENQGLVGNNLNKEGNVYRDSCYCEICLRQILDYKIGSQHAPSPPPGKIVREGFCFTEITREEAKYGKV